MTKQRILITGDVSPFLMQVLLEKYIEGEIEFAFDRLEVNVSDHDMIAEGGNCLSVLSKEQKLALRDQINNGNFSICPTWVCDSITLLDKKPDEQKMTFKTKTIAKHDYPWYHQRSFR